MLQSELSVVSQEPFGVMDGQLCRNPTCIPGIIICYYTKVLLVLLVLKS